MVAKPRHRILTSLIGFFLVLVVFGWAINHLPFVSVHAYWNYPSGYDPHGGYVDRLNFFINENIGEALLALQIGSMNAYAEHVDPQYVTALMANPAVEVTHELSTVYRQFTMRCDKFPTNITGFRRALAFALDKYAVVGNATNGYATPMDGAIPLVNENYNFENKMASHFYAKDIALANATLDAAHIIDTPDSPHPGWRYYDADMSGNWTPGDKRGDVPAPDGLRLWIYVSQGYEPAINAVQVLLDCIGECGLQGYIFEDWGIIGFDFREVPMGCFSWTIPEPGEPWLLYDFWHSEADNNNFFYGYNSTEYDYYVTRMVEAPTRLEARNWSWNCSKLLLQDMPMLTCYNTETINAYRTDIWEGYVNMLGENRMGNNPYTYRHIRLKEAYGGPFGCYPTEFNIALSDDVATNVILSNNHLQTKEIMMNIYSRLWTVDPYTWEKEPDLAWNWTIEPTIAAGDIQTGQKFTFHLYENITWHDNTPFTAADVAYSLMTIHRWGTYTADNVQHIYRIDTPTDYKIEIYTNRSGYFEFSQATYPVILPKHIWEPHEIDNYTWSPETVEDLTGTGPFRWTHYEEGQYIILDRFDNWHFAVGQPDARRPCPPSGPPPVLFLVISIAVIIIVIQVVTLVYLLNRRNKGK